MKTEELRKFLESKGYEVRNIRVFKKSFHVNYWTDEVKVLRQIKTPLENATLEDVKNW